MLCEWNETEAPRPTLPVRLTWQGLGWSILDPTADKSEWRLGIRNRRSAYFRSQIARFSWLAYCIATGFRPEKTSVWQRSDPNTYRLDRLSQIDQQADVVVVGEYAYPVVWDHLQFRKIDHTRPILGRNFIVLQDRGQQHFRWTVPRR